MGANPSCAWLSATGETIRLTRGKQVRLFSSPACRDLVASSSPHHSSSPLCKVNVGAGDVLQLVSEETVRQIKNRGEFTSPEGEENLCIYNIEIKAGPPRLYIDRQPPPR